MDIFTVFLVIILASGVQASFQLSVSIFTLISGHKISQRLPHRKIMKLSTAMVLGVFITNILLFSALAFWMSGLSNIFASNFKAFWAGAIGLLAGVSLASWIFYYKKGKNTGTEIWLPRNFAHYLSQKTKTSEHSAEAFSLGAGSVLAEILFIFPPLFSAVLATTMVSTAWQFVALTTYVFIANFPLFVVYCLISGGHNLSQIQMWRERNQRFLKLFASLGAILLSVIIWAGFLGISK